MHRIQLKFLPFYITYAANYFKDQTFISSLSMGIEARGTGILYVKDAVADEGYMYAHKSGELVPGLPEHGFRKTLAYNKDSIKQRLLPLPMDYAPDFLFKRGITDQLK